MRLQKLDYEPWELLEIERWEKFRNRSKARMPVRKSVSSSRGMHKTVGSRRASHRVSTSHGGIHRRRFRKVV